MPFIFSYLLKLSISLSVVFLFYHFVLRRLTFYNWNRWYLMGYSVLCFFLPFVDISIALEQTEINNNPVVKWVPALGKQIALTNGEQSGLLNGWDYAMLVLLAGVGLMLIRLGLQLISIYRMRKRSVMISQEGFRIYQVDAPIIPFSFGDSIFINKEQHNADELEEIIRHEFVHVKQKHSVDIIWGELLCLLNWYNPFAWLLKKSIRQNLEFIADRHVLEQGMDRKQYQYLLLKVIGNNHFSIANQFNFSSLKKRIAMMNKLRSAKVHLVKFLFVLPFVSVLLLAFRNDWKPADPKANNLLEANAVELTDTLPDKRIAPPPPPPPPAQAGNPMKDFLKKNPGVKDVSWAFKDDEEAAIIFVHRKDGKVEEYDIRKESVKADFISKYGAIPMPPPPPPAPAAPGMSVMVQGYPIAPPPPAEPITVQGYPIAPPAPNGEIVVVGYAKPPSPPSPAKLPDHVKSINVKNGGKAIVEFKNGKTEIYDLTNPEEKKKFDAQYPVPPPPPPPPAKGVRVEGYPVKVATGAKVVEGKPLPDNLIYVINGKISTKFEMENIRPDQIAAVDILKGDAAVALYGENAKEGVVQIKLKNEAQPLYVIDGEISTKEAMDNLKPEQIEAIDVLKGEKATAAYGEKGKNGVIMIRVKK
jgi:TonB-dependent SusC/RagA subfamily outer membrane receptor